MRTYAAGDEIDYTITYLEMLSRPTTPIPARPANQNIALIAATKPPVEYFLYLYTTVGGAHEWTDLLEVPEEDLQDFVQNDSVSLYTVIVDGWPGGFFMLDATEAGTCDLAYFGLVPQAVGRGLGQWFLATAIDTGWDVPGTERLTVNTCTLDHTRALGLYQKMGFRPYRREEKTRKLSQARIETG